MAVIGSSITFGGQSGFIKEMNVSMGRGQLTEVTMTIIIPPGMNLEDVVSSPVFVAQAKKQGGVIRRIQLDA